MHVGHWKKRQLPYMFLESCSRYIPFLTEDSRFPNDEQVNSRLQKDIFSFICAEGPIADSIRRQFVEPVKVRKRKAKLRGVCGVHFVDFTFLSRNASRL